MSDTEPIMCPECGWTGDPSDLDAEGVTRCPVCDADIEFVE